MGEVDSDWRELIVEDRESSAEVLTLDDEVIEFVTEDDFDCKAVIVAESDERTV